MADTQYLVKKQIMGERTYTTVSELSHEERVEEVARLIGVTDGQQESGMAHARAILDAAVQWKRQAK